MIKMLTSKTIEFKQLNVKMQDEILNVMFKKSSTKARSEFVSNNMYGGQDITCHHLSLEYKFYDLLCFEIRKEIRPSLQQNVRYGLLLSNDKVVIRGLDSEIVAIEFCNKDLLKFESYLRLFQ